MRRSSTIGAAVLVAALAAACGGGDSSTVAGVTSNSAQGVTDTTVKFGWMGAITGLSASTLEPKNAGTQAYVEYANKNGGLAGRKIQLISYDDTGVVATGLTNYSRLVNDDKVLAIIGQSGSQITDPLIPKTTANKIPVIGPSATTASQLKAPYYWNDMPAYQDQADVAIKYAADKIGSPSGLKAVTVSLAVPSGKEWKQIVQDKVTAGGGTFVKGYDMPTTATDAVPIALDLQKLVASGGVNYIFLHGNSQSALTLFASMQKFGVAIPVVGIYGIGARATFTDGPPEIVRQTAFVHGFTPPNIDEPGMKTLKDFVKGTKWQKYIDDDSVHFVNGWVDGMIAVEGAKRAAKSAKLDRASLQTAMGTITDFDTQGLSGPIDFSRYGHNGGAVARPYTFTNGGYVAAGSYDQWSTAIQGKY